MPVYKDELRNTYYVKTYYTDWQGNKKQKLKRGFKKKADAKDWERVFLEKLQGNPDMLFSSLVELYLEDMASRIKPSTMQTKSYMINSKILPCFENLRINEIKPSQIRKWQGELIDQGFSQTYLKSVNNQLVAIFNYAVRYYNLKENPCHKAGTIGKKYADKMEIWTTNEFNTFIDAVDDSVYHMAFTILYWTGCRLGELLALTIGDVDISNKTLSISKSLQRINRENVVTVPKTEKSIRVITLPEFLVSDIQAYIKTLYDHKAKDFLFPTVSKYWIHVKMDYAITKAGVKRIRVHDLRHSHASLLIELGFSPLLIAERLGHEKVETTLNIYSHLFPNKHNEVADKLNSLVSK